MSERVYILLPVHNRRDITRKFIDSLLKQTFQDYHLLLIDDGSTDGTEEMVRERVAAEKWTVIKGKGNWWWAGSLQQGINWLKKHDVKPSDIVLMINDDVTFKPDFLKNGVEFIRQHPNSLLLSRFYDTEKDEIIETGVKADLRNLSFVIANSPEDINCLSTRGLFMRWDVCKRIGSFHPVLLPHYWSDYEFTIRAKRKGMKLETCSEVYLIASERSTGHHSLDVGKYPNLLEFLKVVFSKRSIPNPIYRTIFVIIACPSSSILGNLVKTWVNIMLSFIKMTKRSLKYSVERYRLKKILKSNSDEIKIIIGAGPTILPGWIATDYPIVDVTDISSMGFFFQPDTVSAMLAEHVWEHLVPEKAMVALENCLRYLKPGGYIRLAVPDGFHPDTNYRDQVKPGGSGPGAEDHKVLYNHHTISNLLEQAGFEVRLLEWFDKQGVFHYEEWSPEDGLIRRSTRFDGRNKQNPTAYTSLIVDAVKPR